jgi:hypothetical protein
MSCGPSGRDDAANLVTALRGDNEQDTVERHTNDLHPILAVLEASIHFLEPVRILERYEGIEKVDAMPSAIFGSLRGIPLVLHCSKTTDYP